MVIDTTKPQVISLQTAPNPRGIQVKATHKDDRGSFRVIDLHSQTLSVPPCPYGWFIHVTRNVVGVRQANSKHYRQFGTGEFMQIPGHHGIKVAPVSTRDGARIILIHRNERITELPRGFKYWEGVDQIPLTRRPGNLKLWAPWSHTDLPPGIGYDYFAIGERIQYHRHFIREEPPHVHAHSLSLVYVNEGRGTCLLGNDDHTITSDDLIVVPPGVCHALWGNPGFTASSTQWNETDGDYQFV